MKEITVTFENGGVFNGSANSFTLDNLITYYFSIGKNYRVQVNANTMAIELQEYQNTNGAWYGIDTITAVSVQEVQSDVTKEYLKENYYTKGEVDNLISQSGGDVTKDYLNENYYSKAQVDQIAGRFYTKDEADGRYVRKAGDTMTGALNINNAYLNILNNRGETVISLRQSPTNYGGFINIYDGTGNEEYTIQLSGGNHNMRIRNKYNNNDGFFASGETPSIKLYEASTNSLFFSLQPYQMAFYGTGGNRTYYTPSGLRFCDANEKDLVSIANGRIDIFKNVGLYLHTGESGTTEQYMVLTGTQITTYNRNTTYGLTIQTDSVRIYGLVDMEALGNRVAVIGASDVILGTDSSQTFTVNNYSSAMHGNFYGGDSFINALNLFLQRMQDSIKSAAPAYQIVSEVSFGSESFGGGFQAGGGTSRGGGIGRRT